MIFYKAPIVPNVHFYVNGNTTGKPSLKTLSLINNGFRAIFKRSQVPKTAALIISLPVKVL